MVREKIRSFNKQHHPADTATNAQPAAMPPLAEIKLKILKEMRKILVISFTLFLALPCFGQRYNTILFDTVNRNTSAKEMFFKNIIEKDANIYEDENIRYNAIQIFEKFKQTRYASLIEIRNEKNKIIGKIYALERFVPTDTIFKYENLSFNHFLIFSDIKNKTIAIKLYNENQNEESLTKFIEKYAAENKEKPNNSEITKNNYTFTLVDKAIILKKLRQNEISPMMIEPSPTSDKELEKSNSNSSTSIELMIIFDNLSFELKKYLEDNFYFR